MHFTRNKISYSWVSIFPSQVYLEKQNVVTYRTVDGVLDKQDVSANEAQDYHWCCVFSGSYFLDFWIMAQHRLGLRHQQSVCDVLVGIRASLLYASLVVAI
jgi:hypothetical protein